MDSIIIPGFDELQPMIAACSESDVRRALRSPSLQINDLAALLSPDAEKYLGKMAGRAQEITSQRFGKVVQVYAPVYLSNYCSNRCQYCGFSSENKIERRVLTFDEVDKEVDILHKRGFNHILLVAGEAPKRMGVDYLETVAKSLKNKFAAVSIEVQPLSCDEYSRLFKAGITSVAVYQETYCRKMYKQMHLSGNKADYDNRLDTASRAAAAGMREVGIGALLGLTDWRCEGLALGMHLAWLRKKYWRTALTVSFPRLQPAEGGFQALVPVNEKNLSQLIFALRIFDHDAGLLLSTREDARYRNGMLGLGPTRYSAGSSTVPGGYANPDLAGEQFEVDDTRSITEVCQSIKVRGFDPVRKDWDSVFQG